MDGAATYHPKRRASNDVHRHELSSDVRRSEGFRNAVYAIVEQVPHGRVTTYGDVAAMLGTPRAARGVGAALHALTHDTGVPWWRVVNRQGRLSIPSELGHRALQRTLLQREGVAFGAAGAIDLDRFGWDGLPRSPQE